jgi:hypothetical protein
MSDPYKINEPVMFCVGEKWITGIVMEFLIDPEKLPRRVLDKILVYDSKYIHTLPFDHVRKMSNEEFVMWKLENQ